MTKKNNDFMVRYTNKDIVEKIEALHDLQTKTYAQTKATNGRVTLIENKSLGLWISNNSLKFVMYVLLFTVVVISDIRHPLIELILNLL